VVFRFFLAAIGVVFIVGGAINGVVLAVVLGAFLVIVEGGIAVVSLRARRPPMWTGSPDEQLIEIGDAVLARLDPSWGYELGTRDGLGATGIRVATFAAPSGSGPTIWFEKATIFWVTFVVPDGDELSRDIWRNSAVDHARLVDIIVSLCTGRFELSRRFVLVETSKKTLKLPMYPAAVLHRAREGFED
jgi:hypothetical protein